MDYKYDYYDENNIIDCGLTMKSENIDLQVKSELVTDNVGVEDSSIEEQMSVDDTSGNNISDEEFSDRVTMEEFFPHL